MTFYSEPIKNPENEGKSWSEKRALEEEMISEHYKNSWENTLSIFGNDLFLSSSYKIKVLSKTVLYFGSSRSSIFAISSTNHPLWILSIRKQYHWHLVY